jgi:hypothetical protein
VSGAGAPGLRFSIDIDATSHLAFDADRAEALITIRAPSGTAAGHAPRIAEILIMDRSKSMWGHNKIHEALRAACAAIDGLPDGALLGIIAGNDLVGPVFPAAGKLAVVDPGTRAAARRLVMSLRPDGGTKIGTWLTAASQQFAAESGAMRHAVLYTDGKNQHESRAELDRALSTCADQFTCDVRGLAGDWDYAELEHIADTLHGDATAVLDIADLTDDFTQLIGRLRRAVTPRSYLRLVPGRQFRIGAITQEHPRQVDLTDGQQPAGDGAVHVQLGAWEEQETRRYKLSLRFDPDALPAGEDVRAARIDLFAEVAGGARERCADAPLVVRRHLTPGFRTEIPDSLTQVEKERDLTIAMRACADAWLSQQFADADEELALALRLAREAGDARLSLLADIADTGPDGRVRVRPGVTHGEMQRLGLHSTKTTKTARPADAAARAPDAPATGPAGPRACRACGEVADDGEDLKFCEACGAPFGDGNPP